MKSIEANKINKRVARVYGPIICEFLDPHGPQNLRESTNVGPSNGHFDLVLFLISLSHLDWFSLASPMSMSGSIRFW